MTSATVECTVLGAAVVPTRKFSVPLPESFDELAKRCQTIALLADPTNSFVCLFLSSVFEITTIPVERLQLIWYVMLVERFAFTQCARAARASDSKQALWPRKAARRGRS